MATFKEEMQEMVLQATAFTVSDWQRIVGKWDSVEKLLFHRSLNLPDEKRLLLIEMSLSNGDLSTTPFDRLMIAGLSLDPESRARLLTALSINEMFEE